MKTRCKCFPITNTGILPSLLFPLSLLSKGALAGHIVATSILREHMRSTESIVTLSALLVGLLPAFLAQHRRRALSAAKATEAGQDGDGTSAGIGNCKRLERELRRALSREAFHLVYQPLFRFEDGSLLGFEALLRWPKEWPPQSPSTFIPVAEESGLIVPIGTSVLKAACKEAAGWDKPLKVAVNISPVQFRHSDIVTTVREALLLSGLDPSRLELEVTESLWLQNTPSVLDQLARLRAMSISIALDDFGTGYSGLTYLWKFPFDVVKIDRSFISAIETDPKARAIVDAMIALGKTLQVTVTAEGVETEAQVQALIHAGCHQAQGYLFGQPLSPDSTKALIEEGAAAAINLHKGHRIPADSTASDSSNGNNG
jgi:EAL domain-containing protein (putative c-di-GMP-specific phosphodiesterase class I)